MPSVVEPLAPVAPSVVDPLVPSMPTPLAPLFAGTGPAPAMPGGLGSVGAPLIDSLTPVIAPASDATATLGVVAAPLTDAATPVVGDAAPPPPPLGDALGGIDPQAADTAGRVAVDSGSGSSGGPALHAPDVTPELSAMLQVLANPDSRLIIGGLIATAVAGSAAGIGMINFDQVLLQQCGASLRSAFGTVRLIPCRGGRGSVSAAQVTSSGPRQASVSSTESGSPQAESELGPIRVEAVPFRWSVPGSGAVLALFVSVFAALNAIVAGAAAFRHERRFRLEAAYRTRFHA
jgi:hypothetical protein